MYMSKPLYQYEDLKVFPMPSAVSPFWIEMAGTSYCDGDYHLRRDHARVCVGEYIISGKGTLLIEGRTYHPQAGDIYILPEFTEHEYFADANEPWTKMFFNARGTGIPLLLNAFEMKNRFLFTHCEPLRPIFEEILAETRRDLPDDEIMVDCCALFVRLLFCLYNRIRNTDGTLSEAQDIKAFIENNLDRRLSMSEIAAHIYRSKDYTNRIFKRYYDTTPYLYYMRMRMEKARVLLHDTSLTIEEISERLGYRDAKSFSKQFHYMIGMSPSGYRKLDFKARKVGGET